MNWKDSIENYKTYLLLEKSLSKNSISAYLNDIQKLATYCTDVLQMETPEAVDYDLLNGYLMVLCRQGVAGRTQARNISSIRSFFKYLLFDGQTDKNPSRLLETPRISQKLPNILTVEEIDAMLDAVDMEKAEGTRNRAMVETLYSCGLRVSELVTLKLSNINFRKNFLKVEGKGNKERLIPLSNKAKEEINNYMQNGRNLLTIHAGAEDTLFLNRRGNPLSRVMVFNIIKQLAQQAGIHKNISPHTFRHSFATHLVCGVDLRAVQDMLGHESILTTEIYTHLDNHFLRETIELYHPRSKTNRQKKKE